MLVAERKKRAGGQDNKLVEIEKPRGFDRLLPIESIIGVTEQNKTLMFLIKWVDCDEFDLLPVSVVNQKDPDTVIAYYEQRSKIYQKFEQRNQLREEIELKLSENPPTEEELPLEEEQIVEEPNKEAASADLVAEGNSDSEMNEAVHAEAQESVEIEAETEPISENPSAHALEDPATEIIEALPEDIEMPVESV